jgi:ribosomal protein S18 acetylase RimI-like enzyme
MTTDRHLRLLQLDDIPHAWNLSTLAGWNQTVADWQLLLELAPGGCFCVVCDRTVVATATLMPYGNRLGFIGMVLTHPDYRRRGYARLLLMKLLARASAIGIETLKLDATELGESLYRSLGFRREQPIERWWRAGSPSTARQKNAEACDLAPWLDGDAHAFGADRSLLLRKLAERGKCFLNEQGFLLSRPGRTSTYLGPCLARSRDAAAELFTRALESGAPGWCWDLFAANRDAVALATELAFTPQRRLTRMFRGATRDSDDKPMYAIAGFELG